MHLRDVPPPNLPQSGRDKMPLPLGGVGGGLLHRFIREQLYYNPVRGWPTAEKKLPTYHHCSAGPYAPTLRYALAAKPG